MLIKSKLIRAGGTIVTLGKGDDKRTYHFKPANPEVENKNHVCEVTERADISTLLAIGEGYEIHDEEFAKAVNPVKQSAPAVDDSAGQDYSRMDRKQLFAILEAKTGKKSHPATKIEILVEKLQALDAAA